MNATLYLPDDRALFSLVEAVPSGQHVDLCAALTQLVTEGWLVFPPEVGKDIERRADPEDDARLLIWVKTIRPSMTCEAGYGSRRDAQAWAVQHGYPEGLDRVIAGTHGTCVPAVVAVLMEYRELGRHCTVVTGDAESRPSRVALGEVCGKLDVPTVTPKTFLAEVLTPLMPDGGV